MSSEFQSQRRNDVKLAKGINRLMKLINTYIWKSGDINTMSSSMKVNSNTIELTVTLLVLSNCFLDTSSR